ncbi:MAG: WYL domain-containing protein [Chloroflexales bacterium]
MAHLWAAFLADTPPTLQRMIASAQRISLPRRCTPAERLIRLRAALCRGAAVRSVYFTLAPAEQDAVQQLRQIPGGLAGPDLAARFGPIRPLTELRRDRVPRTISERLLLLGWLLLRPASQNHPTHYLLPPELRAWLPVPLPHGGDGEGSRWGGGEMERQGTPPHLPTSTAPTAPPATVPALRAATAILVAAATVPLPLHPDGGPTAAALRILRPRLAPLTDADALCGWLMPLLGDLGLLAPHGAAASLGPGVRGFLAAPPAERLRTLTDAWVRAARPDPWLAPLHVNTRGLDWPALRRRLRAWAAALPAAPSRDPAASYALLHAALGPLADAGTHGFCASPRRPPWLPRRAAEVWATACAGPLAWLGELPMGMTTDAMRTTDATQTDATLPDARNPQPAAGWDWHGTAAGVITVPHGAGEADLLTLAPFARFDQSDTIGTRYTLSRASVATAITQGHDPARLRAVLLQRGGAIPTDVETVLTPAGGLRMVAQTLLLSDTPAALETALRARAASRMISARLAPGVALVAPGGEAALARALARDGRRVTVPPDAHHAPPADLMPGDVASLLLAAAFYRASAPPDAPPGPRDDLLAQLRAGLPPALGAATDAAIAAMTGTGRRGAARFPMADDAPLIDDTPPTDDAPPLRMPAPPLAELLDLLRTTLRHRGAVTLHYQGADEDAPQARIVRPLRLERHGPWWYLHAYCLRAQAERCFRLDRVHGLAVADAPRPVTGDRRRAPRRPRSSPRSGFFVGPPDPSPDHPLVGVWLDEG